MKLAGVIMACGALLLAEPGLSRAGQGTADPITGTWTGHMGRSASERQSITLTLKLDGGRVTGGITGPPSPGEIRTGTFDPATGAIRLEIVVQNEAKDVAIFEGRLADRTLSGQVAVFNQTGAFQVTRDGAGAASGAAGGAEADSRNEATLAALRRSFAEVSGFVTKAADLVPADKYGWRPTESVRTYGQLVAHIADGYAYYCATAGGRTVEWTDAVEQGRSDKPALVAKLKEATEACRAAHAGPADEAAVIGNIAHTNLHYGNLVTYIRMLGMVPPSS